MVFDYYETDRHETVDKVLGIDILVRTNKNKDKIIRFSDINGFISGCLSAPAKDDETVSKNIKIDVECIDYSYEVIPINT